MKTKQKRTVSLNLYTTFMSFAALAVITVTSFYSACSPSMIMLVQEEGVEKSAEVITEDRVQQQYYQDHLVHSRLAL